jgi:hypothetical protein
MKKLRLVLSMIAFVVAIGVTVSSQLLANSKLVGIDGYEFVPASGNNPARCVVHTLACDDEGTIACTIGAVTLRASNTPQANPACGVELRKTTP